MVQGDAGGSFATPAVFPDEPEVLWTHPLPATLPFSPLIGEDGVVYVAAGEELIAVGPDGTKRWAWKGKGLVQWLALGRHGAIYALEFKQQRGSRPEASLAALDSQGRLSWRLPLDWNEWWSPPVVGQGGVIYLGARSKLYAITSEGTVKWSRDTSGVHTWPVELPGGGVLYAEKNEVIALHPDGSLRWTARLEVNDRVGALAIGADGRIYYRGRQHLYALDAQGRTLAEVPMARNRALNIAAGEGVLQDGFTRWEAEGLNPWKEPPSNSTMGLFAYLDRDGSILLWQTGEDFRLTLHDPEGAERWRSDGIAVSSLPAIGADGRICFAGRLLPAEQMALICMGQK